MAEPIVEIDGLRGGSRVGRVRTGLRGEAGPIAAASSLWRAKGDGPQRRPIVGAWLALAGLDGGEAGALDLPDTMAFEAQAGLDAMVTPAPIDRKGLA